MVRLRDSVRVTLNPRVGGHVGRWGDGGSSAKTPVPGGSCRAAQGVSLRRGSDGSPAVGAGSRPSSSRGLGPARRSGRAVLWHHVCARSDTWLLTGVRSPAWSTGLC